MNPKLTRPVGLERAAKLAKGYAASLGARPLFAADTAERGSLYVYEAIGYDWWTGGGVTAKDVAAALDALKTKGVKALDVFVNSPGGDIFEAKAIFANLKRFDGEIVMHIDGIAASAASFIAMAGTKIVTAPAATWMIHEVWAFASGRAADFRAMADVLDLENNTFAETYAKRSGQTVDDVKAWMTAETWMDAATAKARGFTDEVSEVDPDAGDEDLAAVLNNAVSTLRAARG